MLRRLNLRAVSKNLNHEGKRKNRQVRKMTAKVGFPTLRLIRTNIELLDLGELQPSEYIKLEKNQIYSKLKLNV